MRRKIFIAFLAISVILTVFLLVRAFPRPVGAAQLSVSFITFTNDGSGLRCAAFALTNSGPRSVYRICSYRITGPGGRNRDTITNAPLSLDYRDRVLRPGESEMILIPAGPGSEPWRARFDFWEHRGLVWSMAADWTMAARRKLGMQVQDYRRWGTGMSDLISQ